MSQVGAEVTGINLHTALAEADTVAIAERLQVEVDRHALLLFRGQSNFSPQNHLALASLLGKVFPLPPRFQHLQSPHRDILRVSNNADEGFIGVGTTGWHIDGVSYATPFGYSLLHVVCPPTRGPTLFLPLYPLAARVHTAHCPAWKRLWMQCGQGGKAVHHPLLFAHPRTQRASVCLGKTSGLVWDKGSAQERAADAGATTSMLAELSASISEASGTVYRHEWRAGDLVLLDNLAVAHLAPPETQEAPETAGLRVLHRVVVAGIGALRGLSED